MKLGALAVDDYLALQSQEKQLMLHELRNIIRNTATEAEEGIFWNMPGYRWNGPLVYFAAYKYHMGFYPGPDVITAFSDELMPFKTSKGAVQFLYHEKLPKSLIESMVRYRMKANSLKKVKNR